MKQLVGEYECKLDAKGRMVLPAGLKKQIPLVEQDGLVVNRGFEKCLVLYPHSEWDKISEKLSALNQFDKNVRAFTRGFTRGATELNLDAAGRVLLPKSLLEFAGIQNEVLLICQFDKIELWDKMEYDAYMALQDEDDFSNLAAQVMGGQSIGGF